MKKTWEKYERIITIIGFLALVLGWVIDGTVNRRLMRQTIEENTTKIEEVTKAMKKQNNLNGQIIMYMQMDAGIKVQEDEDGN